MRDVLIEISGRNGFKVNQVDDEAGAWNILNPESFDPIISHPNLAGVDGIEMTANIKENSVDTPVLLTSGVNITESDISWSHLSNNHLLREPLIFKDVKKAIDDSTRRNILLTT